MKKDIKAIFTLPKKNFARKYVKGNKTTKARIIPRGPATEIP